jgi:hypothetical protein
MPRHLATLLEDDLREHQPLPVEEPPLELVVERLRLHVVPSVVAGAVTHRDLLGWSECRTILWPPLDQALAPAPTTDARTKHL